MISLYALDKKEGWGGVVHFASSDLGLVSRGLNAKNRPKEARLFVCGRVVLTSVQSFN